MELASVRTRDLPERHFVATSLAFDDAPTQRTLDRIAERVGQLFSADLAARPSRHVYVSDLPADLRALIEGVRSDARVRQAIERGVPAGSRVIPLHETDELYLCHYHRDGGGDEGLFAKHYDGNLRFLPFGTVVRSLIYVRSDGSLEVVFRDSAFAKRFVTYEVGLLDFHRELHWVEGEYVPGAPDRIVLKCNALVLRPHERWLEAPLRFVNVGQFYVVKAAMEYSKQPRTPAQRAVGLLCNVVRHLNNLHPALPHVLLLSASAALLGLGSLAYAALR